MIAIQILNGRAYGTLLAILASGLLLIDRLRRIANFTPDSDEMNPFLLERVVARITLPKFLVLRDAFPTTPSGNIQQFKLREELGDLRGASSNV